MEFLHYTWHDRYFLLMVGGYLALLIGGPRWLHGLMGYEMPALAMRRFIMMLQTRLNRQHRPRSDRKMRGRVVVLVLSLLVGLIGAGLVLLTIVTPWGWVIEILLIAYLIPLRAVISPFLELQTALRKKQVASIRSLLQSQTEYDVERMDGHAILRAGVMSASRLFPRYIIAPSLWYLLLGMPGLLLCRLLSCLSDVCPASHAHFRYFAASAHFWDNVIQAIPTRMAAIFLTLALIFTPRGGMMRSLQAYTKRPAEPAITTRNLPVRVAAYGLNLTLAGPFYAGGKPYSDAWIGQGKVKLEISDYVRSLVWYGCTLCLWLAALTGGYALMVTKFQI